MPCGCTQFLESDSTGTFTICDNAGSLAYSEAGITALVAGIGTVQVPFVTQKASVNYSFIELAVENTLDPSPFSISPEVIQRNLTGFTVNLDSLPDSGNYVLRWSLYVTQL